jgi:hypothetical protein
MMDVGILSHAASNAAFFECFIYTSIGVRGNVEKNKKNIPQLDLGNGERSYKFCHLTQLGSAHGAPAPSKLHKGLPLLFQVQVSGTLVFDISPS